MVGSESTMDGGNEEDTSATQQQHGSPRMADGQISEPANEEFNCDEREGEQGDAQGENTDGVEMSDEDDDDDAEEEEVGNDDEEEVENEEEDEEEDEMEKNNQREGIYGEGMRYRVGVWIRKVNIQTAQPLVVNFRDTIEIIYSDPYVFENTENKSRSVRTKDYAEPTQLGNGRTPIPQKIAEGNDTLARCLRSLIERLSLKGMIGDPRDYLMPASSVSEEMADDRYDGLISTRKGNRLVGRPPDGYVYDESWMDDSMLYEQLGISAADIESTIQLKNERRKRIQRLRFHRRRRTEKHKALQALREKPDVGWDDLETILAPIVKNDPFGSSTPQTFFEEAERYYQQADLWGRWSESEDEITDDETVRLSRHRQKSDDKKEPQLPIQRSDFVADASPEADISLRKSQADGIRFSDEDFPMTETLWKHRLQLRPIAAEIIAIVTPWYTSVANDLIQVAQGYVLYPATSESPTVWDVGGGRTFEVPAGFVNGIRRRCRMACEQLLQMADSFQIRRGPCNLLAPMLTLKRLSMWLLSALFPACLLDNNPLFSRASHTEAFMKAWLKHNSASFLYMEQILVAEVAPLRDSVTVHTVSNENGSFVALRRLYEIVLFFVSNLIYLQRTASRDLAAQMFDSLLNKANIDFESYKTTLKKTKSLKHAKTGIPTALAVLSEQSGDALTAIVLIYVAAVTQIPSATLEDYMQTLIRVQPFFSQMNKLDFHALLDTHWLMDPTSYAAADVRCAKRRKVMESSCDVASEPVNT